MICIMMIKNKQDKTKPNYNIENNLPTNNKTN